MKPADSIQEELKEIAPFLASLQKSHPFTVPENYFDGLEAILISVTTKEHINDGVSLFGLKDHPFNVPDNYFREFPTMVLLKIKDEKNTVNKIKPIIRFTKQLHSYKLWLAAASVALILIVSLSLFTRYRTVNLASDGNKDRKHDASIENTASDLVYAADIDESLVVDLYIQDQNRQDGNENSLSPQTIGTENNYLRDAADIDPYLINEL